MPKKSLEHLGSVLTLITLLFAALAVMQPMPWLYAVCLVMLWFAMVRAQIRLVGPVLIILQDIALRHGTIAPYAGPVLVAVTATLLLLKDYIRTPEWFYPGLSLGAAAVMAFYQCAGYFATGAFGAGMPELLRSYRGLGFHPNWRTVLFSTIMMVILITWPRKFKQFSKIVPGSFVGIIVVTSLNLLLNPDPARSAVPELWRVPASALSMLLIFAAWEEVPFGRIKALFTERRPINMILFCVLVGATLWFDLLWVAAGAGAVWIAWLAITRKKAASSA